MGAVRLVAFWVEFTKLFVAKQEEEPGDIGLNLNMGSPIKPYNLYGCGSVTMRLEKFPCLVWLLAATELQHSRLWASWLSAEAFSMALILKSPVRE